VAEQAALTLGLDCACREIIDGLVAGRAARRERASNRVAEQAVGRGRRLSVVD